MGNCARYTYVNSFMVATNTVSPIDTLEQGTAETGSDKKAQSQPGREGRTREIEEQEFC
jgi:hypothetical protein